MLYSHFETIDANFDQKLVLLTCLNDSRDALLRDKVLIEETLEFDLLLWDAAGRVAYGFMTAFKVEQDTVRKHLPPIETTHN